MARMIVVYPIILFFTAFAVIMLQISLSKQESKWLGLILPFITFCFSLIALLGLITYTTARQLIPAANTNTISLLVTCLVTFSLNNVPTLVLLCIYLIYRGKRKRELERQKMLFQDWDD